NRYSMLKTVLLEFRCEGCNISYETHFLHRKNEHKQLYRQFIREKVSINDFYKEIFNEYNKNLSNEFGSNDFVSNEFTSNDLVTEQSDNVTENLSTCCVCNRICKGKRAIAAHMRAAHPSEWANQKREKEKLNSN